ncbi:MAG: AMP-binding protein [Proteobacteria bacterium]|nr:AMP-binding protein [Pseudomonadota bacterium]
MAIHSTNCSLTYQQLNQRANQLAHWLRQYALPLETPIAVLLSPGVDLIVSLLAILKIGCAYLSLDMQQSVERNSLIIQDSRAKLLITYQALISENQFQSCNPIFIDSLCNSINHQPDGNLDLEVKPHALVKIIY